jgi:hypothetical protein
MKRLEREVIAQLRLTIAHLDTDVSLVCKHRNAAHELFAEHFMQWSEAFAALYNQMMEVYRAHTPRPSGHWRATSIEIGFAPFPIKKWVADKVQTMPPTAVELLERFDALIEEWSNRQRSRSSRLLAQDGGAASVAVREGA